MSATTDGSTDAARAALEAERDRLLRSLDQLDEERDEGDLTDDDHRLLSDRYGAELAAVLRRLDGELTPATMGSSPDRGSILSARTAVLAALVVFAVGAGLLVAQTAGERGVNDELSGEISRSSRSRVAQCQELGSIQGDLLGALQCFDDVLLDDPENAEALSYRGWYLMLAAGSLQRSESGTEAEAQDQADELIQSGLAYLDLAIEADPLLPDPLAFRATVLDRLGRSPEACADLATLVALEPPEFFLTQTAGIAERNGC